MRLNIGVWALVTCIVAWLFAWYAIGKKDFGQSSRTKRPIHIKHNPLQRRRIIRASLPKRRKAAF